MVGGGLPVCMGEGCMSWYVLLYIVEVLHLRVLVTWRLRGVGQPTCFRTLAAWQRSFVGQPDNCSLVYTVHTGECGGLALERLPL